MQNARSARIAFTVSVSLTDRGDYWAAYIEPSGMTVYGDTEAAAIDRVDQAMDFFMKNYAKGADGLQKLRAYLDWHDVQIHDVYSDMPEDDRVKRMQYPVGFPLEAAASV